MADKPHFHNQRQRARFMEVGAGALPEYGVLELVLFLAIPQRDVKPVAKQLIDKFSSLCRGDFGGAGTPERD